MKGSKKHLVENGLYDDRDLLALLKDREQKIAELEHLLSQKKQEIWNYKLLQRKRINPASDANAQYPSKNQDQRVTTPNTFTNIKGLFHIKQEFMCRLKKDFSTLTANDLRICLLLRHNLSTKEVASHLVISPESANKARYRIRKKLNLQRGESLIQFLLEF